MAGIFFADAEEGNELDLRSVCVCVGDLVDAQHFRQPCALAKMHVQLPSR